MAQHSTPKRIFGYMVAIIAAASTACVDDSYDLNNISTEVTIGGDVVIVPLGQIKEKSLGELIGDDIADLVDENGVYTVKFIDDGDSFDIDGIALPRITDISPEISTVTFSAPVLPSTFDFSSVTSSFPIGYPDLDTAPALDAITVTSEISSGISLPSGSVPALGERTLHLSGSADFRGLFTLVPEIARINKLYLGDASSPYGTPFDITLSLNGVKSINGGGTLDFEAVFPSNYELTDENGRSIGNKLTVSGHSVEAGADKISLRAFIRSLDLHDTAVTDGVLKITDAVKYEFTLRFDAVAGYYNSTFPPAFTLSANPVCRDIEVVTNTIHIDASSHKTDMVYTFNGIPEGIRSIDRIAFSNAPIKISVGGLEWLKSDIPTATIELPSNFVFAADGNGYLDTSTNVLTAPLRRLQQGIMLEIESIDCTKGNAELKNGQLTLKSDIDARISEIPAGQTFLLSDITPAVSPVNVTTSIDGATFTIDLAQSEVKLREQIFDFNFGVDNNPRITHTVEIPDEITNIERLDIQNSNGGKVKAEIGLSLPEGAVFPVDKVTLDLSVNLKRMICPAADQQNIYTAENGDRILRLENLEWRPNTDKKLHIATIEIDAIENLPAITSANGGKHLVIDETLNITGGVTVADGSNINLEATKSAIDIDFDIDDITISKFTGTVDYKVTPSRPTVIELGDLADFDLRIDDLAVDPIIEIDLDNPLGVAFDAAVKLNPFNEQGTAIIDNTVSVDGVRIAGNAASHIVISTERRRAQFENKEGVTFFAAELGNLFRNKIPSTVAVDFDVHSKTDETHIVDLTEPSYSIAYGYSVSLPLEFGRSLDISYEDSVTGLSDTFADIADNNISVGEIAVIADFSTDIPLDMLLSAEFVDADGNPTDVKATIGAANIIKGHDPKSSRQTTTSTIEIAVDLGKDGSLEKLKDVDGLKFGINLRNNTSDYSALSSTQTVSGIVKLRVKGGITIDWNDPVNGGCE